MAHEPLIRCLKTLTLLQSRLGYSAAELAREFGVSPRTVYRDLRLLEEAGIPVSFCRDRKGYVLDPVFSLRALPVSNNEWVAVILACCESARNQVSYAADARQASAKILARLPPELLRTVAESLKHQRISEDSQLAAG